MAAPNGFVDQRVSKHRALLAPFSRLYEAAPRHYSMYMKEGAAARGCGHGEAKTASDGRQITRCVVPTHSCLSISRDSTANPSESMAIFVLTKPFVRSKIGIFKKTWNKERC